MKMRMAMRLSHGQKPRRLSNSSLNIGSRISLPTRSFIVFAVGVLAFVLLATGEAGAQKKSTRPKAKGTATPKAKGVQTKPVDELAKLREEFVKATNDYKASLEKLRASYEKGLPKAEERLVQSKDVIYV